MIKRWRLAASMLGLLAACAGAHAQVAILPAEGLAALEKEGVTMTAGVPTIWIGLLDELGKWAKS